jgi:hypothetical protein
MEDLSKEEIIQLLVFYKNKSSELEFSYLMLQLNNKKVLDEKKKEYENALSIKNKENSDLIQNEIDSHNATKTFLKEIIEKKNKELERYKTKNNKVTNKKS